MEVLERLTSPAAPPKRRARVSKLGTVWYSGGDASGGDFGGALIDEITNDKYRHGEWSVWVQEKSSNYRELRNLVELVEEAVRDGSLDNTELFLFTDNTTAEYAFYKGNSSNKDLFELVERMHTLTMDGRAIIHIIHIAGTRMIECGIDGLSRGITTEGIMQQKHNMSYVPLHKNVLERSSEFENWIHNWWSQDDLGPLHVLTPDDWFKVHREEGGYLWTPAPAAADVCVEQMGKHIFKRPWNLHIFVCPRLWTSTWRKQLKKTTDISFEMKANQTPWDTSQHEPLIFAVYFPLSQHSPWRYRRLEPVVSLERKLPGMWQEDQRGATSVLQQLCISSWRFREVPSRLVPRLLQI